MADRIGDDARPEELAADRRRADAACPRRRTGRAPPPSLAERFAVIAGEDDQVVGRPAWPRPRALDSSTGLEQRRQCRVRSRHLSGDGWRDRVPRRVGPRRRTVRGLVEMDPTRTTGVADGPSPIHFTAVATVSPAAPLGHCGTRCSLRLSKAVVVDVEAARQPELARRAGTR